MKRTIAFILILCTASFLAAQKAYIYDVTGHPIIESATGVQGKAVKGSALAYDEFLTTEKYTSASLVLEKNKIVVGQNSGLGFLFTGTGTDPHPAFVPAAGIVTFTFTGTASVPVTVIACGTKISDLLDRRDRDDRRDQVDRRDHAAFTVYIAIDGSAVVSVTAGAVEMETGTDRRTVSAGEIVELKIEQNERMTESTDITDRWTVTSLIQNDEPVFNYTVWKNIKTQRFLEDPLTILEKAGSLAETQCVLYDRLAVPYAKATVTWRQAADEYRSALASENENTIKDAQTKNLFPAQDDRLRILNEMRFHARMALIVRRFSLEKLFAEFNKPTVENYQAPVTAQDFLFAYNTLIQRIDEIIANDK